MRKKRPLDRTIETMRDANLVVIASEDKYAVRQYFEFFRSTRIQFKVLETDNGRSAPEHVLKRLDGYMKEYDIGEGDEFWLVCDCDHWIDAGHIKNLKSVLTQCRQKEINVALTHPCFDLWLLLHFADFPEEDEITCKRIGEMIRDVVGAYNKTKVYNLPIDDGNVQSAVERSGDNEPALTAIPESPQSAVHRIIKKLIKQKIISVRSTRKR